MVDSTQDLTCPACGKRMTKFFIPSGNVSVDICMDGCGGIFFDNRELNRFVGEGKDAGEILQLFLGKTFMYADQQTKRVCPACGTDMVKNYFDATKTVQVDECYRCGGKFLDHGELEKISKK